MSLMIWLSLILMLMFPGYGLASDSGCDPETPGVCLMQTFMELREGCADAVCETGILLDIAAMGVHDQYYLNAAWDDVSQQVWDAVDVGVSAFRAGDYASALASYQALPEGVQIDPMISFSAGLIYEQLGEDERALAEYRLAAQQYYKHPLIYYSLGSLNARLGRAQESAVDFYLMAHYSGDPAPLTADAIPFENWLAYPVFTQSSGVAGSTFTDRTLTPARAVKWAQIEAGSAAVAENLGDLFPRYFSDLPPLLVLHRSGDDTYSFRVSYWDDYGEWGGTLMVNTTDFSASEDILIFESMGRSDFLVAPAGEPDPRARFEGERCPGAALSRLNVGGLGWVIGFEPSIIVYDTPTAADGTPLAISHFSVIAGPECAGDEARWQIETEDGVSGWIAESDGSVYQAMPDE